MGGAGQMTLAFDLLLALSLLWSAWRTLATPRLDRAIVLFIVFGLLMSLAWARLAAPDIGAGRGGDRRGPHRRLAARRLWRVAAAEAGTMKRISLVALVLTLALAFVAVLAGAMLELGPAAIDLRVPVAAHLADSGVTHPVTAVLLNFRGYDTLLEIAVLLLALLGILAVVGDARRIALPCGASGAADPGAAGRRP